MVTQLLLVKVVSLKIAVKYSTRQFPFAVLCGKGLNALVELRKVGFDGIQFEMHSLPKSTEHIAELRKILDNLGLTANVHSDFETDAEAFVGLRATRKIYRIMHKAIEIGTELDSSSFSFHPPKWKAPTTEKAAFEAQAGFMQFAKELKDHADAQGLDLALESYCYRPFIVTGISEFRNFVNKIGSLKIVVEIGHLHQAGFDPLVAIRTFASRLIDAHVHDAMRYGDYRKRTHLPLGRGEIDFAKVLQCLREIRYDKWLTFEIVGTMADLVGSYRLLKDALGRRGAFAVTSSKPLRTNVEPIRDVSEERPYHCDMI